MYILGVFTLAVLRWRKRVVEVGGHSRTKESIERPSGKPMQPCMHDAAIDEEGSDSDLG